VPPRILSSCKTREGLGYSQRRRASAEHPSFARHFPATASMNLSEFRDYHEREAMRLRSLIANATTPALKARLLEEAEKHEQITEGKLADPLRAD
jgi:hypothetical protein